MEYKKRELLELIDIVSTQTDRKKTDRNTDRKAGRQAYVGREGEREIRYSAINGN